MSESTGYAGNPQNEDEQMFYNLCASVAMKTVVQVDTIGKPAPEIAIAAFDMADAMLIEYRRRMERP